jgi:hypothetical protein
LSPHDIGIPHKRGRCFVVAVLNKDGDELIARGLACFAGMVDRLKGSVHANSGIADYLLAEDDPRLHKEVGSMKMPADVSTTTQTGKSLWVHDHLKFFVNNQVPWLEPVRHSKQKGTCGYSAMELHNSWYQHLTDRDKHFLHYWDTWVCSNAFLRCSKVFLAILNPEIEEK